MSVNATYQDGVFKPIEETKGLIPGTIYTVFSQNELRDIREASGWLNITEPSFDFWNNEEDDVYDSL